MLVALVGLSLSGLIGDAYWLPTLLALNVFLPLVAGFAAIRENTQRKWGSCNGQVLFTAFMCVCAVLFWVGIENFAMSH